MKDFLIFLAICLVVLGVGWYLGFTKSKETIEPQIIHHETTVYDTITDVQENTVQVTHFDTVFLPVFLSDTLTDTLQAEIPISQYVFDTVGCRAVVSGYGVTLDTLQVETKIITDTIIVPQKRKWHFGFGFAIGIGYVK